MQVIAQRGSSFLVAIDDENGRVLTTGRDPALHAPHSIASIAARGYWHEFTGDPAPLLELAGRIEERGTDVVAPGRGDVPAYRVMGGGSG